MSHGVWRFAPLLVPVPSASRVSLDEGGTPLVQAGRSADRLGIELAYKDEARNPTGTFKDRGLAVAVSVALAHDVTGIVCASTGNAGAAAAAYGARANLPVVVLVPERTPAGKMAQALIYGAHVLRVRGTYSDAYDLADKAASDLGWLNTTSTFACPYTVEGARTVAYELYEKSPKVPDWIVVPIGSGPLLVAILEGFADLLELELVSSLPRMLAVQAAGCAPIVRAFQEHQPVRAWDSPRTVAGSLADPLAGYEDEGEVTLAAIRTSNGGAVAISDGEILAAVRALAREEGLFHEPGSAISLAAVKQARSSGWITAGQSVVACLTGTGLKDPRAALKRSDSVAVIEPTREGLEAALLSVIGRASG